MKEDTEKRLLVEQIGVESISDEYDRVRTMNFKETFAGNQMKMNYQNVECVEIHEEDPLYKDGILNKVTFSMFNIIKLMKSELPKYLKFNLPQDIVGLKK